MNIGTVQLAMGGSEFAKVIVNGKFSSDTNTLRCYLEI